LAYDNGKPIDQPLDRIIRGLAWEETEEKKLGWSLVGSKGICLEGEPTEEHNHITSTVSEEIEKEALTQIRRVLGNIRGSWSCNICDSRL
jgi:hypothetical protein